MLYYIKTNKGLIMKKKERNLNSPQKTLDAKTRQRYGVLGGIIGTTSNFALFLAKIVVGIFSNSITIISDAINNLTDCGSSAIVLAGSKLASKPADKDHPFGHARYEYIAGLFVTMFIFATGVLLAKQSIEQIITPTEVTANIVTYIVLGLAIFVKLFLMIVFYAFSKKIDSETLKATAIDNRNDVFATSATLASTIFIVSTGINIDGYTGLLVALMILLSGVKLLKEIVDPLLSEKVDEDLVKRVKEKVLSYDGILGVHDLMLHAYGKGNYYGSVHAEISDQTLPLDSQELMDQIERDVFAELRINLVIHTDPIQNNNENVQRLRKIVEEEICKINEQINVHDFRIVDGKENTNLVFDVASPFGVEVNRQEITTALDNALKGEPKTYRYVITFEKQMQ